MRQEPYEYEAYGGYGKVMIGFNVGYGFSNGYGVGFGGRLAYISSNNVYFGAVFLSNRGNERTIIASNSSSFINSPVSTETMSSIIAAIEVGKNFPLGVLTLRPYVSAGLIILRSRVDDRRIRFSEFNSSTPFFGLGFTGEVDIYKPFFAGLDVRSGTTMNTIFGSGEAPGEGLFYERGGTSLVLLFTVGVRL